LQRTTVPHGDLMGGSSVSPALELRVLLLHDPAAVPAAIDQAAGSAAEAVGGKAARINAGVEGSRISTRTTLRGRLRARAVDWIEADAGALMEDLLVMAQALVSENEPLPAAGSVRAVLVPLPEAVEAPIDFPAMHGALTTPDDPESDPELERLAGAARTAVRRKAWAEVLAAGEALLAYADEL